MFRVIRVLAYPTIGFLLFRLCYPDAPAPIYHMITLPLLWGLAAGTLVALGAVENSGGSLRFSLSVEALCLAAVFLYLGTTWPVRGKKPLERILSGQFPRESEVRRGCAALGLDCRSGLSAWAIEVFPD